MFRWTNVPILRHLTCIIKVLWSFKIPSLWFFRSSNLILHLRSIRDVVETTTIVSWNRIKLAFSNISWIIIVHQAWFGYYLYNSLFFFIDKLWLLKWNVLLVQLSDTWSIIKLIIKIILGLYYGWQLTLSSICYFLSNYYFLLLVWIYLVRLSFNLNFHF